MTAAQLRFLQALMSWTGAATPQELGPQTSQEENAARQACKRKGWVTYEGGYWRITDAGKIAIGAPTTDDQWLAEARNGTENK